MSEPIHIISLGAGVQSSTMALMAALGEIKPMPVAAIFADTQAEPASVYRWLDWLEKQLPFPVHRVTRGSLEEDVLKLHKSKDGRTVMRSGLPHFTLQPDGKRGIGMRQCTHDYKVVPITRKVREIAGKKGDVIQWIGISADEIYRVKPSQTPHVTFIWPLVERGIRRVDCLKWFEGRGFPKPPRSACVFCPYHNDNEWRRLRDEEPSEFQRAVEFERKLQRAKKQVENYKSIPFLHNSMVPLDKVDFSTEEERGQGNLFNNACEGLCGV